MRCTSKIFAFLVFFNFNFGFCQKEEEIEKKTLLFNNLIEQNKLDQSQKIGLDLIKAYRSKTSDFSYEDINNIYRVGWVCEFNDEFRDYLDVSKFGSEKAIEKYGEYNPISILFFKKICEAYYYLEDFENCIIYYEKIIELQKDTFDLDNFFIIYAGNSFYSLGQRHKSKECDILWLKRQDNNLISSDDIELFEIVVNKFKPNAFYLQDYKNCIWANSMLINVLRGKNENCKLSKAYLDQGEYYMSVFDLKKAKSYIDSSDMLFPELCNNKLKLLHVKSEYFKLENNPDSSLSALKLLIKKVEDGEDYHLNDVDLKSELILNLMSFGYYFEAQKEIDGLLIKIEITDPNYSLILTQKCDLNNRMGNFSNSINLVLEYISQSKINTDNLDLLHGILGNSYGLVGRFNESNEYLMPLINKMDTSSVTWDNVINSGCIPMAAFNFYGLNDNQGVINLYNQYDRFLLQNNLFDPLVRLSIFASYAYQNIGDYEKSISLLDRGKNITKEYSLDKELYFGLLGAYSQHYLNTNQYKECLTVNEELSSHYSQTNELMLGFILFNSAICYLKLGDNEKSKSTINEGFQLLNNNFTKNAFQFSSESRIAFKTMLDQYLPLGAAIIKETDELPDFFSQFWFNFNGFGNTRNYDFQDSLIGNKKLLQQEFNLLVESNSGNEAKLDFLKKEIDRLDGFLISTGRKDLEVQITDTIIKNVLSIDDVYVDIVRLPMSNLEMEHKRNKNDSIDYLVFIVSNEKVDVDYIFLDNVYEFETDLIHDYKSEAMSNERATDLKNEIFYNSFWKPIADKIEDAKTVYVSLGGVYNNINLNTLYNAETGKYLIEEKDIRIVNSARDFVLMKEQEKKQYTSTTSALYGFPDYNGNTTSTVDTTDYLAETRDLNQNWIDSLTRGGMKASALPATKMEVEQIAGTFQKNGWHVSTYTGTDASETNIKKEESPRVLHVATHGYFFEDIPMDKSEDRFLGMDRQRVVQDPMLRSGLLFTGANKTLQGEQPKGENGLLSAAEASLLDLRETELVVLSACETGKGEIKNSEGVYGLRKAFADAGAQNIIMSLWKVDDKVTQEFMSRFYEIWLNEKTTIRVAFNRTQLEIKAKYPQPYYWGAFILVGE
jgi:CHAT domain-containing protein/tetratricopeptide (TPR) repeat protein